MSRQLGEGLASIFPTHPACSCAFLAERAGPAPRELRGDALFDRLHLRYNRVNQRALLWPASIQPPLAPIQSPSTAGIDHDGNHLHYPLPLVRQDCMPLRWALKGLGRCVQPDPPLVPSPGQNGILVAVRRPPPDLSAYLGLIARVLLSHSAAIPQSGGAETRRAPAGIPGERCSRS